MFLPADLLAGFPKLLLIVTILFPPFQHVSKLLLIVASLAAVMKFDTFRNSSQAFFIHPVTDFPSPKVWFGFTLVLHGKIFPTSANSILLPGNLLVFLTLSYGIVHPPLGHFSFYNESISKRKTTEGPCFLNLPHMSLIFPLLNFLLLSYYQFVCAAPQFFSPAQQVFSSIVHFPQSALWLEFLHYFALLVQHFFHLQGQQHSSENKLCHV